MIIGLVRMVIWLAVVALIVQWGWNEPLRYRFMSRAEIAQEEQPVRAAHKKPDMRDWHPNGTSLDRGAYRRTNAGVVYTGTSDTHGLGVATEAPARPNTFFSGGGYVAPAPTTTTSSARPH